LLVFRAPLFQGFGTETAGRYFVFIRIKQNKGVGVMLRKIVTHREPRHFDDFIAVSILKMSYPDAVVETVHPQSVPQEYYQDRGVCLVDVGGRYEPELFNFDHHQDLGLNCSLILVLKDVYGLSVMSKVLRFIDIADRYGVRKASEEVGVALDSEEDRMRKEILLIDVGRYGSEVGKVLWDNLLIDDYSLWIRKVYTELEGKGLLDEPRRKLQEEEVRYLEKVRRAVFLEYNGLRVCLSDESFAPYHSRLFQESGVDLLIERNSMERGHTSVIKNTNSEKAGVIDVSKVFEVYPKVFLHKGGFIAVVGVPFEGVDKELVLELVVDKGV
jgi:hypothetical protein